MSDRGLPPDDRLTLFYNLARCQLRTDEASVLLNNRRNHAKARRLSSRSLSAVGVQPPRTDPDPAGHPCALLGRAYGRRVVDLQILVRVNLRRLAILSRGLRLLSEFFSRVR